MKPTQFTELFANIRKTFVSFFSILMFVALGVGIYLGISWAAPALQNAADSAFDKGAFHNFQVQFPYGLTNDDIARLAAIEGVADVEAAYQSFQTFSHREQTLTMKVQSMSERIDVLTAVEGNLPAKPDEMALGAYAASELGIAIGDTVTFEKDAPDAPASQGNESGMRYLKSGSYTVTALVNSPEYLANSQETYGTSTSASGTVNALAWVRPEAFDADAFQNGYPIVSIRCESLKGLGTFSDEYGHLSSSIEARISELGSELAPMRYNDLHSRAQSKVDEGEEQVRTAKEQIASGEAQLERGRAELESARAQGEDELASAYQQLKSFDALKADAEAQLAQARERFETGQQDLSAADAAKSHIDAVVTEYFARGDEARAEYEASAKTEEDLAKYNATLDELGIEITAGLQSYADMVGADIAPITHDTYFKSLELARSLIDSFEDMEISYEGAAMTVREARAKLEQAAQQISNAEALLAEKSSQLSEGWRQYYSGWDTLQQKTDEAEQQLESGEQQLAQAQEQVASGETQLESAKEQLEQFREFDWTVLPRAYNASVAEVSMFGDITTNLSFSMAALFVIVGLLVSYSAVSRIVHEQITQIGTKKALGLREREITLNFLAYSAIAVISGAVIGTAVGVTLVEGIIGRVLGSMFALGSYPPYFGIALFLIVTALELALVIGATWFACHSILRENAVELLKGEQPPEAKTRFYENWGVWDRLPLFTQTIVNNCINDKRRVFSTIVGVAGCTALIVTAITLNNDVLKSYDRQYEDVYGFNAIVYIDTSVDNGIDSVEAALKDESVTTAQVSRQNFT